MNARLVKPAEIRAGRRLHASLIGTRSALAARPDSTYFLTTGGEWRSLVAHLVWDERVAGSNPVSPTIWQAVHREDWGRQEAIDASQNLPTGQDGDAVWSHQDPGLGDGIRARGSVHTRPADGLE